jgi:dinuclear metal center YbgI/SA1388 family protein
MKIKEIIKVLEEVAPPMYQESYDNAGLIVGDANAKARGVLFCLDSTEAVLEEAIEKKCNLIVAHHPIVFKGLKRFTGKNYVERVVIKAIKNDLAIYAIHTNLDNVYHQGVNAKFAERLGLERTQILAPKGSMKKLNVVVPTSESDAVRKALFAAGAGNINGLHHNSYASLGVGTQAEQTGAQVKLEVIFPASLERAVLKVVGSSYDGMPLQFDISDIRNTNAQVGSGMIGTLPKAMTEKNFLRHLKEKMHTGCIKHTALRGEKIEKVALCGGSGGFLLSQAIAQGADIFVTSDYKYHEFFDADGQIIIADIGHYESEQFTIALMHEIISQKFSNFAAYSTEVNTNPVQYFN